jgi:signal transduction histidine kinase/ActR/RegA family two-component response regulator
VDVRQYDWTQYVHPEDRHEYVKAYLDAAARSGVFDKEFRFRRHDGEYRWMRSVAVPRLDADGTRLGYTGCTFDVHDARLADRRKDDFLATLAHELRNPLAPVRNAVEILRVKRPADADIARSSDVIARQVTQMARLLDDLLDVSRITRDKLELRKQPVTLDAVVESAVETSRPLLDAAGHRLEIALPKPIYVDGDPTRLAQIFANLLNNAAKYTPRGGSIRLTAERRGNWVVVSVKDNGIGFAPEMRPRLFEMFSQAAPALDRSQGGLGIGLSLVKALTEMHGGSVEAHSDGPGQGSEFLVRLPVMAPDSIRGTTSAAAEQETSAGIRRRLLVVDDLKDAADSLAALLRMLGHEVHVAYDGEQGVAAARRLKPEVVFLDLGMPRLNGYEACRIIRSDFGQEVFLVALTGWGQDDDRRRSAAAGFDRHLVKPVEPQAVTDMLLSMPQARGGRIAGGNRG